MCLSVFLFVSMFWLAFQIFWCLWLSYLEFSANHVKSMYLFILTLMDMEIFWSRVKWKLKNAKKGTQHNWMFCFVAAFNVLRPFGTSGVVNETDTLLSISKHDAKQYIHGIKYLSFTLFLPLKQINKQTNKHTQGHQKSHTT